MAKIGYARVSTDDQHPAAQSERLIEAGCERVFTDAGVSGAKRSRPELDALMAFLRPGDALVAVKLDRLGRSVLNLCEIAGTLDAMGCDLVILDQAIDTSTAPGKLMFHVLAAMAEFERTLIRERTIAGLAATTKRSGAKPKLGEAQLLLARKRLDDGAVFADVAAELGVHRGTLYRALERAGTPIRQERT